jgi:site-specific recombinase XerD
MLIRKAISGFISGYFSTCHRSPKTLAAYSADLKQFAAALPRATTLAHVAPETIERWASGLLSAGYAPTSVRRKLASVTSFFNYWVRRRELERSPLWQLRLDLGSRRPLTRVLTRAEIESLIAAARTEDAAPPSSVNRMGPEFLALRDHALVELMFATGMRVGEVAALTMDDLLPDGRAMLVKGKGDRHRLAFLVDDRSRAVLQRYTAARKDIAPARALFINIFSCPLSTRGIARVIAVLARRAGITRRVTPHMLRHTIATLLLSNGADIRIVQEFLGHSSISTTQRYTHVSKEHLVARLRVTHPNLARIDVTGKAAPPARSA